MASGSSMVPKSFFSCLIFIYTFIHCSNSSNVNIVERRPVAMQRRHNRQTRAITRQWPIKSNRGTVFFCVVHAMILYAGRLVESLICKSSINPIINPKPVYSCSYRWQYELSFSMKYRQHWEYGREIHRLLWNTTCLLGWPCLDWVLCAIGNLLPIMN